MSQQVSEIRCLVIPLRSGSLLLPNTTVAEIIGYREPDPVDHDAPWLQGKVNWHQREILVVDFERMLGRGVGSGSIRQRIAVCYALKPEGDWPLVGLVAQGIPRLLRLNHAAIDEATTGLNGDSPVRMTVTVDGDQMMVPDLDYLQAQLPAA